MNATMSVAGLFVLAALAGFVFLAVLGLITLLTNPKTRDVAKILFGGLAAVALLIVLIGGLFVGVSRQANRQMAVERLQAIGEDFSGSESRRELESDRRDPGRIEIDAETSGLTSEDAADTTESDSTESPAEEPEAAEEESGGPGVKELSVPLSIDGRPAWAERKPYKEGSVYYWPIVTDPAADVDEVTEEELPKKLNETVAAYVEKHLGRKAAGRVSLEPHHVFGNIEGEDVWFETVNLSMGPWVRMHALLKFDHEAKAEIEQRWEDVRMTDRLWRAGGVTCLVLLVLSMVYSYLKIDQVTGGSRRGLLRIAAFLVILGLVLVIGTMAARLIA